MGMKVRIDIDTGTFVRFWLVVIGFGLAGAMIYLAREALLILGVAVFMALALSYPVKKIASKLPGKSRVGGTAISFASLVIILVAVIGFVVPPVVQQSARFATTLPALTDQAYNQWSGLETFIDDNGLHDQVNSALENVKDQAAVWAANVGKSLINGVGSLASFLVAAFLVIVLSFLMLVEGPLWMERLWKLYTDKEKMMHHKELVSKTYNVVTGYISGQLTISGIGALAAGACVFILSFFFPVVDAGLAMPTILVTFVLALIPMFGATLAGVIITLLLLLNSPTAGIIYGIYFIVYQQIENNFISTVIQAKKVELSALIVLVAVMIGIYVSGLVGGVIAIPIAGTIKVFVDDYLARRHPTKAEKPQGLARLARKLKKEAS